MTREQLQTLTRRKALPHPSRNCEVIETHISLIILTDNYAYKLKKPVDYSFLNFSTLERRRYYCYRELYLNSRLTHSMYLEVLPVRNGADGLVIGGNTGEIVDYALVMRRMDNSREMDRMLPRHQVTRHHLLQIARQLTAFHQATEAVPGAETPEVLDQRFADLLSVKDFVASEIGSREASRLREIVDFSSSFLQRHARRIYLRNQLGLVVDGHGDLHSKNILLLDQPVIFDCIEFNDAFRQLDVLNEVAFFCMDLDYYGFPRQADQFLSDYLNRMNCIREPADWRLFHYFKAYRANVRLKVNCLRAMQPEDETDRQKTLKVVRAYFRLLEGYYQRLRG